MGSRMRFLVVAGLAFFVFMAGKAATTYADGFLYVTSNPEKAIIKIDGETQGTTPVSISLPAGTYLIEASLASYNPKTQKVVIKEGEVTRGEFTLTKATTVTTPTSISSGKGNITFITDWTAAEIYLDGVKRKETTPVTIKDIPAGRHWLIITSKGYAIYQDMMLQNQETRVFQGYFEKVKAGTYQPWSQQRWTYGNRGPSSQQNTAAEIEKKRQALPATINLKMTSSSAWGTSDSVVITFQYRKSGTDTWETKELQFKTKEEDTFTVDNGTYDVKLTAVHSKGDTSLLGVLLGAAKKVGEVNKAFTQEFAADKLYVYTIAYDGASTLTYKLTETSQNTVIQ